MIIEELIKRVESLSGPDRRIDSCTEVACGFAISREGAGMARYERGPKGRRNRVPHYTASLDAAIALVERRLPGWRWGVTQGEDGEGADEFQGNVWPPTQPFAAQDERFGYHALPAIALLLALLRSLPTQDKTEKV